MSLSMPKVCRTEREISGFAVRAAASVEGFMNNSEIAQLLCQVRGLQDLQSLVDCFQAFFRRLVPAIGVRVILLHQFDIASPYGGIVYRRGQAEQTQSCRLRRVGLAFFFTFFPIRPGCERMAGGEGGRR